MSSRARRKRRHDGTGGRTSGRIGWSVIHRGMSIVRRAPNGFLWAKGLIPIATPSSTLETGDRRGKTKGIMISHASDFQLSLWFPRTTAATVLRLSRETTLHGGEFLPSTFSHRF